MRERFTDGSIIFSNVNPDFYTSTGDVEITSDVSRRLGIAVLAFMVWVTSVLLIAIIPALFLAPYLATLDVPLTDSAQIIELAKNDPTAIFLQIAAIIPAHILTGLGTWLVISQFRKFAFLKTLGWDDGGVKWWHYCIILGGFLVVAAVVGAFFPEQENDLIRILRSSRAAVYVVAIVATFSAPFIEELIYRGILYSAFQRAFGIPAAFILVTLLFALVHVPQYYPSYSTIFLLTLLSMTLTAVRVFSNNLWPCVVLHTIFNGFQAAMLLIEPLISPQTPKDVTASILHLVR